MEIKIFLNKSVNENANIHFEKAKRLKNKLPGLEIALKDTNKLIEDLTNERDKYTQNKIQRENVESFKSSKWYDKFRWTKTFNDFLFVIGKDAGTNEVLIKKHTEKNDLIFHTETPGSPFGILKDAKDKVSLEDLEEAGQFLSCFSKQWKSGFGTADAFWVLPEQVSKKTVSGEYMGKGSFMVYGKKNIIKNIPLRICLGKYKIVLDENSSYYDFFSGSERTCRKICNENYIKMQPGRLTYKLLTNELKKKFKILPEDLPKLIPNDVLIIKK